MTTDKPQTFQPAKGRPHIAELMARPDEDRLLMVLAYLAEPKHRAES